MAKKNYFLACVILLIIQARPGQCRDFTDFNSISNGVDKNVEQNQFIGLKSLISTEISSCEETYGFLPCTNTVLGNIFLVVVYGCSMFFSAKLLSDGSEILLQILGPGIVGGLFLPVLGALPDSAIILGNKIFNLTFSVGQMIVHQIVLTIKFSVSSLKYCREYLETKI